MSRRAFWPGFTWRILAHHRTPPLRAGYTDKSWEMGAGPRWQDRPNTLDGDWELDEVVIDDWFHIEQMDVRVWWMQVGNQDGNLKTLWVTVDRDGKAEVRVYDE